MTDGFTKMGSSRRPNSLISSCRIGNNSRSKPVVRMGFLAISIVKCCFVFVETKNRTGIVPSQFCRENDLIPDTGTKPLGENIISELCKMRGVVSTSMKRENCNECSYVCVGDRQYHTGRFFVLVLSLVSGFTDQPAHPRLEEAATRTILPRGPTWRPYQSEHFVRNRCSTDFAKFVRRFALVGAKFVAVPYSSIIPLLFK